MLMGLVPYIAFALFPLYIMGIISGWASDQWSAFLRDWSLAGYLHQALTEIALMRHSLVRPDRGQISRSNFPVGIV